MQEKKRTPPSDSVPPITDPTPQSPERKDPLPNTAWLKLSRGEDIDALTEEERRDLYIGPHPYL